jgi:hypothetical protein
MRGSNFSRVTQPYRAFCNVHSHYELPHSAGSRRTSALQALFYHTEATPPQDGVAHTDAFHLAFQSRDLLLLQLTKSFLQRLLFLRL